MSKTNRKPSRSPRKPATKRRSDLTVHLADPHLPDRAAMGTTACGCGCGPDRWVCPGCTRAVINRPEPRVKLARSIGQLLGWLRDDRGREVAQVEAYLVQATLGLCSACTEQLCKTGSLTAWPVRMAELDAAGRAAKAVQS